MDDKLKLFKPLDPGRVNTLDPLERRWWCSEFHCTDAELMLAVQRAGEHAAAVRQQLAAARKAPATARH